VRVLETAVAVEAREAITGAEPHQALVILQDGVRFDVGECAAKRHVIDSNGAGRFAALRKGTHRPHRAQEHDQDHRARETP